MGTVTPEDPVKKEVASTLSVLKNTGDVFWYSRLNAGAIRHEGYFIRLCADGTYDFICIFQGKTRNLIVMFIECKRPDKPPELNDNQKKFLKEHCHKHPDLIFMTVRSGIEVRKKIFELCLDCVAEVEWNP